MKKNLGKRIKYYRKERNISQNELSQLLHVTQATVARWESGDNEPSLESLSLISEIFAISLNELIGITMDDDPYNEEMLKLIQKLNEKGKERLMEQANFFASSEKYKKKSYRFYK